jgi:DNA helicase-2/ATP-dependent DNA helicase PcrA
VRLLRERNALDLDDLILEAVALLEADDGVRSRLQRHFGHILADEYQDTNPPQARLLRLLTRPEGNITVVGDDDQAIYGWRQADVRNMLEFANDFPRTVTVRLEENYRSTQRILLPANHLLEHNRNRLGKTLFSRTTSGPKPIIFAAGDESEEVLFIRAKIQALLRARLSPREIAILYRINAQSRVLEDGLVRAGIEYEIRAGNRFYERPEVARIVDILRALSSPHDLSAWTRLLSRLPGIGPKRSESILLAEQRAGRPVDQALRMGGFKVPPAIGAELSRLGEKMRKLDAEAPVGTLVRDAAAIAEMVLGVEGAATLEREAATVNVDEFISVACQFDNDPGGDLIGFLDRMVLAEPRKESSGVQLMTMHAAKGLEFEAVFICGLEEGILPHAGSLADSDKLEEERRLLYVGMTRAKRFLQLSYARSRLLAGVLSTSQPSRFLDEMPGHLFEVEHGIDAKPRRRLLKVTVGDRVRHLRWGAGTIAACSGESWNEMIVIAFDDGTRQTVQRRHAPLERIS